MAPTLINFTLRDNQFATASDSDDGGSDADVVSLIGPVKFIPQINRPALGTALSPQAMLSLRTIDGYYDTDGQLKNKRGGSVGVRIPANDPVLGLTRLPYKAVFGPMTTPPGGVVPLPDVTFDAPATDTTVWLPSVAPVPGATAPGITRGDKGDPGSGVVDTNGNLTALAALTSVANKVPYATGSGAWALADFTAAGRALVDDADAAAQRTTLGIPGQTDGRGVASVADRYETFSNGQPATTASGLPYTFYAPTDPAMKMSVSSGRLVPGGALVAGSYAQVGPITPGIRWARMGFTMTAESVTGGIATLVFVTKDFVAYHTAHAAVPQTGPHILIDKGTISVTVFESDSSSPTQVMDPTPFVNDLPFDDATVLWLECVIDKSTGVCWIVAPDGEVHVIQHDAFKNDFPYAFTEAFRNAGSPTGKSLAKITSFECGPETPTQATALRGLSSMTPIIDQRIVSGSDVGFTLSNTPTQGSLPTTFTYRNPGIKKQVIIRVELPIAVAVAFPGAEIIFGITNAGDTLTAYDKALVVPTGTKITGQMCKLVTEVAYSDAIPGEKVTFKVKPYVTNPYTSRSVGVTSGSATVTDTGITAADRGRPILDGSGYIPTGNYVGTVTPGVSFLMSSSPTDQLNVNATNTGTVTGYFFSIVAKVLLDAQVSGHITVTPTRVGELDL